MPESLASCDFSLVRWRYSYQTASEKPHHYAIQSLWIQKAPPKIPPDLPCYPAFLLAWYGRAISGEDASNITKYCSALQLLCAMSLHPANTFFSSLIPSIISDLRRIADRTHGKTAVENLQTEAWLVAEELSRNREPPPDVGDRGFHQQILGCLYNRSMKFADRRLRGAVRIGEQHPDDGGATWENSIAVTLVVQDSSDPSKAMEARESEREQELAVFGHSAEAVVHLRILALMKNDRCTVAAHLTTAVSTLHGRMKHVEWVVRLQPSLSDGITAVPSDFTSSCYSGRLSAVATTSEKHRPPAFLAQLELFVRACIPVCQLQQRLFDNNSPQTMNNK